MAFGERNDEGNDERDGQSCPVELHDLFQPQSPQKTLQNTHDDTFLKPSTEKKRSVKASFIERLQINDLLHRVKHSVDNCQLASNLVSIDVFGGKLDLC